MSNLAHPGEGIRPSPTQRAAVIYRADRVDLRRLQVIVEDTLEHLDWEETLWLPTATKEPGHSQVEDAVRAGATHVVVIGGDGTIRHVLQGLFDSAVDPDTVSLGIVPVGTGNVLARNLGIHLGNLQHATRQALIGSESRIDLGVARLTYASAAADSSQVFSVMAGVGLDAKIFANTDKMLKSRLGWVAYIDGGFKSLPSFFERMSVSVNDGPSRTLKLHSLIVGNCGLLPGGILLMPDASVNDGVLDVAAVGPRRFWNWMAFWSRVTWQNTVLRRIPAGRRLMDATANIKTLENLSGQKISVRPERAVAMQLDGDAVGTVTAVEFSVLPSALRVRL